MQEETLDVAVVGAGPYGLSVAAYAISAGLGTRVFGTPMNAWDRHMPQGMLLKSEPFASHLADPREDLTLAAYCAERDFPYAYAQPTPVERFVDYGRWFCEQAVGDRITPADVASIDKNDDGLFQLILATGERILARTVVLAVGFLPFARVPATLASLPSSVLAHSCQVHDPRRYAGKAVAVIGAGQSAIETAVLLREAGAEPHLIARAPQLLWNTTPVPERSVLARCLAPQSGLGTGWRSWLWSERPALFRHLPAPLRRRIVRTTLGPAGSWWLRERFTGIPTSLGARLRRATAVDGADLTLQDESGDPFSLHADHVIAATGYVVDVRRFAVLAPEVRTALRHLRYAPVLSKTFESSVAGLFIVGLAAAPTFGPVMRFVHGSRFAAATLVPGLVARIADGRKAGSGDLQHSGEPSCR
ncbi:NAD(P)-binding domain-containing protein [Nonomuraea typhae]|uniref:NAD(P)-binding domain-containing protein n=1 Tax=Nonomuraea typhae TaxID=2603600 RepID=UPI0012FB686C|nr:NAD(P)-binding domain-containing protein [Nonomuraea typhae]